jgi:hypothetical protein
MLWAAIGHSHIHINVPLGGNKYTLLIMEDIVFKVVRVSSHKARIINIVENPIVSEVVVGSSRLHLIFEEKDTHKDLKEKFRGGINP